MTGPGPSFRSLILAAGKSLRMGRLGERRPKHFLPVANVALLDRHIAALEPYAPTRISHSRHKQDVFKAHLAGRHAAAVGRGSLSLHLNPLIVEGPLYPFLELIQETAAAGRRDFVVIGAAGDAYSPIDLADLVRFHASHDRPVTIVAAKGFPTPKALLFSVGAGGRLEAFARTAGSSSPRDLVNLGYYVAGPRLLEVVGMDLPAYREDDVIAILAGLGAAAVYLAPEGSININTPYNLLLANLSALKRLSRDGPWDRPGAGRLEIETGVLRGEDVEIHDSARLRGVVLGDRVRIGRRSRLENVLALPGARVGEGAVLTNVILGEGAAVPDGARLSEAVAVDDGPAEPMPMLCDPSFEP